MSSTLTDISSSGPNYGKTTDPAVKDVPPASTDISSSGPGYGSTPPPAKTGVMDVMNPDQIAAAATSQINNEIGDQVAPLQAQFNTTSSQEERVRQSIESMFGGIQPYVTGAADQVKQSYDQALGAEQGIFSSAMQQLNQLKQSRAQEAQALAQEMGGPVALSEFTAGVGENQTELANLGAGQMLHTLGYAQAGEQEAQAWAGRVFPLVHTEEQAKARGFFEDKKRELQDQITSLKQSAGSKIEQRKNDLLVQERTFQLQKTQQALDSLKASHDWKATLRQLKNDDARVTLAQKQQALDEAGTTGTYKGKPTLAAKQLTAQEKQQAAQLGLDEKTYALRKQQLMTTTKLDRQKMASTNRLAWSQWLDIGYGGSQGKSSKISGFEPYMGPDGKPANPMQYGGPGIKHPEQFRQDAKGNWYHRVDAYVAGNSQNPIHDPGALVDYLVSHNVPKKIAVNMVRSRLRIPNWSYGQRDPHAPKPPVTTANPGPGPQPGRK